MFSVCCAPSKAMDRYCERVQEFDLRFEGLPWSVKLGPWVKRDELRGIL